MKKFWLVCAVLLFSVVSVASAQEEQPRDTSVVVLTLEDALKVALSENIPVKIADKEVQRAKYARKGSYAALFPQIDGSFSFQRTIKKQVMYMDFEIPGGTPGGEGGGGGLEVGRWNTWSGGVSVAMPVINAQLWEGLKISGEDVELAVEKARGSRIEMVTEVKSAFYQVLWAKVTLDVYKQVYDNARKNLDVTQMRYNAQKVSEMDLVRAKTTVANAVPNLYSAANALDLSLWQLKAVMGLELEDNIDVAGSLEEYAKQMFYDLHSNDNIDLSRNTSLRQLDLQIAELAGTVKMNKFAYIPSLSLVFNYSYNAMANNFNFSEYKWTPYSYVGLSISIPIFSGGKRFYTMRQSEVQHEQLQLQRVQAEKQLRIGIKSALSTMESNMNTYYAAGSAVESARKGYEITEVSYHVGRSTLVELNDAMLALTQAQLQQWQAVYTFLVAKAELEGQLGTEDIQ